MVKTGGWKGQNKNCGGTWTLISCWWQPGEPQPHQHILECFEPGCVIGPESGDILSEETTALRCTIQILTHLCGLILIVVNTRRRWVLLGVRSRKNEHCVWWKRASKTAHVTMGKLYQPATKHSSSPSVPPLIMYAYGHSGERSRQNPRSLQDMSL